MRLSRKATAIFQIASIFGHLIIPTMPFLMEWKIWLHNLIGFAQAASAILAHAWNPDGTPAAEPYQETTPRRRRKR